VSASLVWFRNDLRLADNPALIAGPGSGGPVVPVYVLDGETDGVRPAGAASRWWLHHSLHALDALRALGSRLILRRGAAERVIDASAIYWNRAYEQGARERDARLKQAFNRRGVVAEGLKANLLFEPWEVLTAGAGAFWVFSAFWRACRGLPSRRSTARAAQLAGTAALAIERSRRGVAPACFGARLVGLAGRQLDSGRGIGSASPHGVPRQRTGSL
jgi:deoxyribodipyrimidine photo-lyase